MQHLIKRILDGEFAANDMEVTCRVEPKAWQYDQVTDYQIKLLFRGGQSFMTVFCKAQRPFVPKLFATGAIEPHKMIRLCEVIVEAFKELERKSEEGEGQFK